MNIEKLYNDPQFKAYCKMLAGNLGEDLFSETLLVVMQADIKHGNIGGYFKKTAYYMWIAPNSKFNKMFRPKKIDITTLAAAQDDTLDEESEIKRAIMQQLLDKTPENKRERFVIEVFREYLEKGSYRKIAEETGISYRTIGKTVQKFKKRVDDIYKYCNR